jgi:HAMP domain-containing protein
MSLRTRLLVAFAYVLAIVIVALEVPLALNLSRRVSAEVKSESQGQAQLLAASISGRLDDPRALRSLVSRAAGDLGGRVLVVDVRGRLVVDSAGSGLGTRSYASRPEIGRALAGRTEQGIRHSNSLDEDLLVTAVPVVHEGRREGAVRVTQSVAAVQSEIRRDIVALIGVGAVALLFGLAVAWLLARSLVRPLEALACTARQVAGGDLDARAEEAGSREQRQLAAAFNEMTARLARALRAQREFVANASHQLRTPLTGLRLRLESAALKIRDRAAEPDLGAAERETERLAKLLDELLTLATGAGASARTAARPGGRGGGRARALGGVGGSVRACAEVARGGGSGGRRHRGRLGRDPGQPDRQRARVLARPYRRDGQLGSRREVGEPGGPGRGPRNRPRGARAAIRALLPRKRRARRLGGHRAGALGGGGARAALGRKRHPRHSRRRRGPGGDTAAGLA